MTKLQREAEEAKLFLLRYHADDPLIIEAFEWFNILKEMNQQ